MFDIIKKYLTNDEYKLYSMIYDRSVSSLMSKAKVLGEQVVLKILYVDFQS